MKFFNSVILFSKITYRNNNECNIISIIKRKFWKLLEKFDYSRLIRVRIWNSLGWPRIGINRIPATKMYSPNRRKCQSICKYSIVLPPYSRTNDNFLLRNEHSVVLHLFFHSVRNSARIQAPLWWFFCFKKNIRDGQFYCARRMSISTSLLRWLNRNDNKTMISGVAEYKFHCPVPVLYLMLPNNR